MNAQRITSTDYAHPRRPLPVKLANAAMGLRGARWRARMLSAGGIMDEATRKTGLVDLSHFPLVDPLDRLCGALREEARLSPLGVFIQRTRLLGLVINRLRLDELMRRHPEILEGPEPDILLIAGLARSGTTHLHRLLAVDPDARSLHSWEALNPAPLPGEARGETAKRRKLGEQAEAALKYMAPDFSAVHTTSAHAPEEDILLLDLTMMSQTAEATTWVPSYSAWLETQDHGPAYAYFRRVLMALNWLNPKPHWVLKTPNHVEQLQSVFDHLPGATVIQTHRDPMKTTPSLFSLMAHAQGLCCASVDAPAIARHWFRKATLMADRAAEARAAHPDRTVIDVHYADLLKDPMAVVSEIYKAAGKPLSDAAWTAMRAQLVASPKGKDGVHRYSLADFGFTEADVREAFAPYLARHAIPVERATP